MRTTLTIDDDLHALLERCAKESQRPFKVVLNEVLRRGAFSTVNDLTQAPRKVAVRPFEGMTFLPGIDPNRMNQLSDELETEHCLEKMRKEGAYPS